MHGEKLNWKPHRLGHFQIVNYHVQWYQVQCYVYYWAFVYINCTSIFEIVIPDGALGLAAVFHLVPNVVVFAPTRTLPTPASTSGTTPFLAVFTVSQSKMLGPQLAAIQRR